MKYSKCIPNNGRLKSVDIYEGETIERKVARITLTKEPITDTAPIIYTEKKMEYYRHITSEQIDST